MMKKIFAILLLFISLMVQAADKYIATAANGGSNSNSGTSISPWLTLTYACAYTTTSGDIIHVGVGTFTETSRCVLSVGVSIVGEGTSSVIKSNYVATSENDGAIYLKSSSGVSTNGNQSISYIELNGNSLTSTRAIAINFRNNVEIHHCTIINFYASGVYFYGSTSSYPKVISTYHSTGNSIHDCNITNCCTMNVSPNGLILCAAQQNMLIYNNILDQTARATDLNGEIYNTIWLKDTKIYNNIVYKNYEPNEWNFFSEFMLNEGGLEIYNNIFNGVATLDIVDVRKGTSDFGCKVHDNLFTAPKQTATNAHGIQAIDFEERGAIQDCYVYNNHFKNINTGVQVDAYASTTDKTYIGGNIRMERIYIYYNIFENVGNTTNSYSSPIAIKPEEPEGSTTNLIWDQIYIDNNTIISGTTYKCYVGVSCETGGAMSNIFIRNNILVGAYLYPVYFSYNLPGTDTSFSVLNNLYYSNGTNAIGYNGMNIGDISGFTLSNPTPANPLFVSTTDFHLQGTSPAIGTGIHITTPPITTDFEGVPIGNPPDIGAYEFISNHSPSILDQGFQLNENSPDGTSVGTVIATDPDAGQKLTYSIIFGNSDGTFAINDSTGELSVSNSAALNADFEIVVKVKDNGVGELSSQAIIAIEVIPTGIELTGNTETIKVYPNPVSDELIIEIEGNKNNPSIEILNLIGQVVFEGNLSEKTVVQTSKFSPGIYLMKIENCGSYEFKKIVKM
jgi:hypothetical protein